MGQMDRDYLERRAAQEQAAADAAQNACVAAVHLKLAQEYRNRLGELNDGQLPGNFHAPTSRLGSYLD